jgi:anti-repressor protein
MNELQVFSYHNREFSAIMDDKENPWFIAANICEILGLSNPSESLKALDDEEKSTLRVSEGGPERNIISESGLYSLIMRSNKPEAKNFKKWITAEVLPSIRKKGSYSINSISRKQLAQMLLESETEKERLQLTAELQQKELEKAAPKVQYHDRVLQAQNTFTSTTIAKELGMSAQAMHHILKQKGVIFFRDNHWVLYSKYQAQGYTKTRTHIYETIEDNKVIEKTNVQTVWTEKGREFLHRKLNSILIPTQS